MGLLSILLTVDHLWKRWIDGISQKDVQNLSATTDKLKKELPNMLKEHRDVVSALDKLMDAAREEDKLENSHFAEKLKLHARTEEEVLYPAAVLVGEFIKMKSSKAF